MKKISIIIAMVLCTYFATAQKKERIVIRGFIENAKLVDSITLVVWKHMYSDVKKFLIPYKQTKLRLNNRSGYFEFTDTISGPIYLCIGQVLTASGKLDRPVLNNYIGEPGDSITIFNFGGNNAVFYGKGKEKYECRYAIDKKTAFCNPFTVDTTGQLTILAQFRNRLTPFAYDVLAADVLGKYLAAVMESMNGALMRKDTALIAKVQPHYTSLTRQAEKISERAKVFSVNYIYSQLAAAVFLSQQSRSSKSVYGILNSAYKGAIREKLLTSYLIVYFENPKKADSLLEDALTVVHHPDYLVELQNLQEKQSKGKPAFDFLLSNEKGEPMRLHDFKGKVVFIDFWFTGCKACMLYHENFLAPVMEEYKNNRDIVFLTVNIDDTRERWLRSLKGGEYTSPGAINLYTDGQGSNHEVIKHYKVYAYPRPLLIDKNGNVFATSNYDLRIDQARFRRTLAEVLAMK